MLPVGAAYNVGIVPMNHAYLEIGLHPFKVQTIGLGIKVAVVANLEPTVDGNGTMVAPGRSRHKDRLAGSRLGREPAGQELGTNA